MFIKYWISSPSVTQYSFLIEIGFNTLFVYLSPSNTPTVWLHVYLENWFTSDKCTLACTLVPYRCSFVVINSTCYYLKTNYVQQLIREDFAEKYSIYAISCKVKRLFALKCFIINWNKRNLYLKFVSQTVFQARQIIDSMPWCLCRLLEAIRWSCVRYLIPPPLTLLRLNGQSTIKHDRD